jgi:hypothetical protein
LRRRVEALHRLRQHRQLRVPIFIVFVDRLAPAPREVT